MSDTTGATDTGASTQDGNNSSDSTSGAGDTFTPITSQDDLNRVIDDRLKRERSKFSDYKDLKDKAAKFDELDAANKTEIEKANDRATKAESEAAALPSKVAEALRAHLVDLGVVSKDDEVLLTASDPDALLAQVKRLNERAEDRKKNGNVVPKEGANTPTATSDERTFVRELFGNGG
jgi:hypothetical protein